MSIRPVVSLLHLATLSSAVVLATALALQPTGDSPTHDEWSHLLRGVAYWNASDTRLSFAHPPLANAVAGVVVAHDAPPIDETLPAWHQLRDPGDLAYQIVRRDYETWRELLLRARRAMALVFGLGLAYVGLWVRRTYSTAAAVPAVVFVGFNPTIIAHAQYVTTDLAVAFAGFAVVAETASYLGSRARAIWLRLAIALSLALGIKHSGLLLVPFVVGVLALAARFGTRWNIPRFAGRRGLWTAALDLLAIGLVCLLALAALYQFDQVGLTVAQILAAPEPQYWVSEPYHDRLLERVSALSALPDGLPVPLPYTYLFGLTAVRAQSLMGFPDAVFMGESTPMGHPAYFPTLLLFKTPIPILLLLLAGVVIVFRRRRGPALPSMLLLLSLGGFMLVLVSTRLNMGIRHALFAEVVLAVLAGVAFGHLWRAATYRWLRVALLLLPALSFFTTLREHPHALGWFNPLVGRERGLQISPVGDDWGQDRARVAQWLATRSEWPVFFDRQTPLRGLEIDHLQIRHIPLRCRIPIVPDALVVIHRTTLATAEANCLRWRDHADLEAVVSNHVLVFRLRPHANATEHSRRP